MVSDWAMSCYKDVSDIKIVSRTKASVINDSKSLKDVSDQRQKVLTSAVLISSCLRVPLD